MEGDSPLMKLPVELRNLIYGYAIVQEEPIDVTETTKKKEPALLATCKQIREEALKMFYHENAFQCYADIAGRGHKDVTDRFCWLVALGKSKVSFIKDFRLRLGVAMDRKQRPITSNADDELLTQLFRNHSSQYRALAQCLMAELGCFGLHLNAVKLLIPDSPEFSCDVMLKIFKEVWVQALEDLTVEQIPSERISVELVRKLKEEKAEEAK